MRPRRRLHEDHVCSLTRLVDSLTATADAVAARGLTKTPSPRATFKVIHNTAKTGAVSMVSGARSTTGCNRNDDRAQSPFWMRPSRAARRWRRARARALSRARCRAAASAAAAAAPASRGSVSRRENSRSPRSLPLDTSGARRRQRRHGYRFTFGHGRRRRGCRRRREALHELLAEPRPFQLEPVPELVPRYIYAVAGFLYECIAFIITKLLQMFPADKRVEQRLGVVVFVLQDVF